MFTGAELQCYSPDPYLRPAPSHCTVTQRYKCWGEKALRYMYYTITQKSWENQIMDYRVMSVQP